MTNAPHSPPLAVSGALQFGMQMINEIVNLDCVAGMRKLGDESIRLSVTSCPWDRLRRYGGQPFRFVPIAEQLFRITAPGGIVAWEVADAIVGGRETGTAAKQRLFFEQLGFWVWDTLAICTVGMRFPYPRRYIRQHRSIFVLSKGRPRTVNVLRDKQNVRAGVPLKFSYRDTDGAVVTGNFDGKQVSPYGRRSNVWWVPSGGGGNTKDRVAFQHPAIMPETLAEDLIISFSRPGDLSRSAIEVKLNSGIG
jgi:hypothetical protein